MDWNNLFEGSRIVVRHQIIDKYRQYLINNLVDFKDFGGFVPIEDQEEISIIDNSAYVVSNITRKIKKLMDIPPNSFDPSEEIIKKYFNLPNFSFYNYKFEESSVKEELNALLRLTSHDILKVLCNNPGKIKTDVSLTYNLFQNIPDQSIEAFVNLPQVKNAIPGRFLGIDNVVENTQSLGVGKIKFHESRGMFSESREGALYFKVYNDKNTALREVITNFHKLGTDFSFNASPPIFLLDEESYVNINNQYFLLMAEQDKNMMSETMRRNKHNYFLKQNFELINSYDTSLEWQLKDTDKFSQRMYVIAAFHTEMKNIFIPNKYNNLFHRQSIVDFDILLPRLSNSDYKLVKPLETVYDCIKKKHLDIDNLVLAHNDTKFTNWSNDNRLLDFGTVSFGQEFADIERALFDAPVNEREKYRIEYLYFRGLIEHLIGNNYSQPNFNEFNRCCIERGFTDSLKLMNWSLKKEDGNFNFYKNNLLFYQTIIKR